MSYGTPAEFVSTLSVALRSQLSAESGTAQDTTIVQACLDKASAALDSRVGMRYLTPVVAAVPAGWLKQYEYLGAVWYLFEYRGIGDQSQAAAIALKSWESALAWADKIASGDYDLPGASPRSDASATALASSWRSNTPVFTKDTIGGF